VSDLVGPGTRCCGSSEQFVDDSASVHYFPQVLKMINELDEVDGPVLIEARLVEVFQRFPG